MTTGVASACPQCGAPLRFGSGQSLAAVCAYCRSAVARTGANLELVGKVPDLVATDTRLTIGTFGEVSGISAAQPDAKSNAPQTKTRFQIIGRMQLDQGEGTWNEWYATLAGGSWMWLAEAQGRLYVTRLLPDWPEVPAFETLSPGQRVKIPGIGTGAVEELNTAKLVSMEGELPFFVSKAEGLTYRFADLSTSYGGHSGFVTFDYGDPNERAFEVKIYAGRQASYAELGLGDKDPRFAGTAEARVLDCPNCGGRLPLKLPEPHTLTCPSCRALLDLANRHLRVIEILERRVAPTIPLGAKGTLHGESLEAIGAVKRMVEVEGMPYMWEEILLFGKDGYRWLSVYEGHWLFLRPIPVVSVYVTGPVGRKAFVRPWPGGWTPADKPIAREEMAFSEFQTANAQYLDIQGEFYWQLRKGQWVSTADYIAPPFQLSCERTDTEMAWSLGIYVTGKELWKAFNLPGEPPRTIGVGTAQPNPHTAKLSGLWRVAGVACALLMVTAMIMGCKSRSQLVSVEVPLTQPPTVTLSEPFDIYAGPQAVEIIAHANVRQTWVSLDVALINDETAESEATDLELSDYAGSSGGENWHEQKTTAKAVVGSVPNGRYVLRVEPQLEPYTRGTVPPTATVRIESGPFLAPPFILILLLILAYPLFRTWRKMRFERLRWENSDYAGAGIPEFLLQMIDRTPYEDRH